MNRFSILLIHVPCFMGVMEIVEITPNYTKDFLLLFIMDEIYARRLIVQGKP